MNELEMLMESEFGNTSDLLGLDTESYQSLMGVIKKLPPTQQIKAVQKIAKNVPVALKRGSRNEMELRFGQLPKEIREGLLKKRLQLVDQRFYVVKEITSKSSIDVIVGTDQKAVGLANIANGKLEKDNWFILTAIKIGYAISATKESAEFGLPTAFIKNGEFELEAGNKKLLPAIDAEVFNTTTRSDIEIGVFELQNPKLIEPQVEIKMPFKFAASAGASVCWLKITFIGTSIVPY